MLPIEIQLKKMLKKHLKQIDPRATLYPWLKDEMHFEIYGSHISLEVVTSIITGLAKRLGYVEERPVILHEDILQLKKGKDLILVVITVYRNKARITFSKHEYTTLHESPTL